MRHLLASLGFLFAASVLGGLTFVVAVDMLAKVKDVLG